MKVLKTRGSTMVLDGGHGLGQVVNQYAVGLAIERARDNGSGWVSIRNSSHCGALAYFGQQLARAGMVGFVFSHVDPMVLPHNAREPFHGTNPLCIAAPGSRNELFCLDIATSIVPWNYMENARIDGRLLAPGLAVDKNGDETIQPGQVHALRAFGGHRGSGLGLAIDILCALLSGSPFGPHIPAMYGDLAKPRRLGGLVGALDIAAFTELAAFKRRVGQFAREVRSLPSTDGSGVLIPNDPERQRMAERRKDGIPMPHAVFSRLVEAGEAAGLPLLRVIG
jgi:ureidoglycolate dehydrogenase (NAD+)